MDIRARVHVRAHIEYMCVCLCAHVRTFGETLPHPGIVNSLLTKLLNGVTTRAKAFSFFFFLQLFFSSSLLRSLSTCQLIAGGGSAISILFFILEAISDERYM